MVQAFCAVAAVGITWSLARMNKRYIQLTREQLENARRQTEILVQPNLHIVSSVDAIEYAVGHKYFEARVTVHNRGAYPVLLTRAMLYGYQRGDEERLEEKLSGFWDCIVPAGRSIRQRIRVNRWLKSEEDLAPFSDFLTTTIECRDLAGLCLCEYSFSPAEGLRCEAKPVTPVRNF